MGGGSRKGRTVVVGGPAGGPWDGRGKKLSEVEETPEAEQGIVLFILHRMAGKNRLPSLNFQSIYTWPLVYFYVYMPLLHINEYNLCVNEYVRCMCTFTNSSKTSNTFYTLITHQCHCINPFPKNPPHHDLCPPHARTNPHTTTFPTPRTSSSQRPEHGRAFAAGRRPPIHGQASAAAPRPSLRCRLQPPWNAWMSSGPSSPLPTGLLIVLDLAAPLTHTLPP